MNLRKFNSYNLSNLWMFILTSLLMFILSSRKSNLKTSHLSSIFGSSRLLSLVLPQILVKFQNQWQFCNLHILRILKQDCWIWWRIRWYIVGPIRVMSCLNFITFGSYIIFGLQDKWWLWKYKTLVLFASIHFICNVENVSF